MPNWVFSTLTVEGNPESVIKLKEQLNKPFDVPHSGWNIETNEMEDKVVHYSSPVFSFMNVYSPFDNGITMEEYAKQPERSNLEVSDPNWWADIQAKQKVSKSWYDWNITNWGTKWDIAVTDTEKYPDTELYDEEPNGDNLVLVYKFQTAWSPAIPVLIKLSEQYPELLLTLDYEEENGWGGEIEFLRGKINSESSYDWKCRECDYMADETPYCDTCEHDMCPDCGYGEPDEEDREKCQDHKVELDFTEKAE